MVYLDLVEDDAVRCAIPADESGEALLHAIQRVLQVPGGERRGRRGVRTLGQVLPSHLPAGVGGEVERATRRGNLGGTLLGNLMYNLPAATLVLGKNV